MQLYIRVNIKKCPPACTNISRQTNPENIREHTIYGALLTMKMILQIALWHEMYLQLDLRLYFWAIYLSMIVNISFL